MEQPDRGTVLLAEASKLAALLGRNCRERRISLNMSQAELSQRTGVAASHLSRIENGQGNPTLEVMETIAHALQCRVVDLIRT